VAQHDDLRVPVASCAIMTPVSSASVPEAVK
jgi:hypothetical protein